MTGQLGFDEVGEVREGLHSPGRDTRICTVLLHTNDETDCSCSC